MLLLVPCLFVSYYVHQLESENLWLRDEVSRVRGQLSESQALYEDELAALRELQARFDVETEQLRLRVDQLQRESRASVRRPSESELKSFLASDPVSMVPFRSGSYICTNYAADLKRNAVLAGWNISVVIVNYNSSRGFGGHVLNGAYLSDGRWVWIEPQRDLVLTDLESHLRDFLRVSYVKVTELAIVW
jgi:hypothetical protein